MERGNPQNEVREESLLCSEEQGNRRQDLANWRKRKQINLF